MRNGHSQKNSQRVEWKQILNLHNIKEGDKIAIKHL